MKAIVKNLHWFIILYTLWFSYGLYEEHEVQIESLKSQSEVLDSKILKAKRDQKRLDEYYRDIEAAKDRIDTVARKVEKLQSQLPNSIDHNEIKKSLQLLSEKMNIKNLQYLPQQEENKGFYFSNKVKVNFEATYLQLLVLLEKIEQYDRILNVISIKIDKKEGEQKGSFKLTNVEMTIETYRYNQDHKEKREIDLSQPQGGGK